MDSTNHSIENLMKTTMENLRDMIDVNTVIGDSIETRDGSYIVPISKVSVGFASGGSEIPINENQKESGDSYPFGGGSGAGISVKPVAFLVVKEDSVKLLPVDQVNTYDRIADNIPQILDMVKDFFSKNKECKEESITEDK